MSLEQTTVGTLVAEQPGRSRVLEKLGIDYCCGGKLPLEEACRKRGLDPAAVVAQLREADETGRPGEVDAAAMGLAELADHIEQAHHAWLREELPRLDGMTKKVSAVHGESEPRLREVREAFCALREEMFSHMQKEEQILFPAIRALERGEPAPMGSVAGPIAQMEHEHEQAGGALAAIRAATDDFEPPAWACGTYRAMLAGLADLEADMHRHIHKENNVLFPRAMRLEAQEKH
ncbi:MAG: iron-sulfur cluster repair di-iron protein [Phycisphaerales bacterium JB039]